MSESPLLDTSSGLRVTDLAQRRAVVTGAAHGIGLAIALALADQAVKVVAVDRDRTTLEAEFAGTAIIPLEGDVAGDDPGPLAQRVQGDGPPVELIVNNLGIETDYGFLELEERDFDLVFQTNLRGPWFFTKRLVGALLDAGRPGRVLFISSLHDTHVFGKPHYSTSKAAVAMLVKELASELAPHDIRVNAISPGGIETKDPPPPDLSHPAVPLGRAGLPADIAQVAVTLLSDDCSRYVTGVNVPVDGGARLFHIWSGGER